MGNSYSCVFRQISIHAPREGGDQVISMKIYD